LKFGQSSLDIGLSHLKYPADILDILISGVQIFSAVLPLGRNETDHKKQKKILSVSAF